MNLERTHITTGQIKTLAEWCGLQVTVPAGMTLSNVMTINRGQLAELLVAVEKHKRVHALETENAHLQLVNSSLTADLRAMVQKHEELSLDNEVLQRRALPKLTDREVQKAIGILKITDSWLGCMERLRGSKHPAREALGEVQQALFNTIVTTSYYDKEHQ